MKKLLPKKSAFAASRCNRQRSSRTSIFPAILLVLGLSSLSSLSSAQQARRIPGQRSLQTAAVAGTIRDQDGRPVPGVVVEFRSRVGQKKFSAIASSEGIYRLNSLPVGDYDVAVTGTGFAPSSANLSLRAAQLQVLDLQLQSASSAPAMTKGPSGLPGPVGRGGTAARGRDRVISGAAKA